MCTLKKKKRCACRWSHPVTSVTGYHQTPYSTQKPTRQVQPTHELWKHKRISLQTFSKEHHPHFPPTNNILSPDLYSSHLSWNSNHPKLLCLPQPHLDESPDASSPRSLLFTSLLPIPTTVRCPDIYNLPPESSTCFLLPTHSILHIQINCSKAWFWPYSTPTQNLYSFPVVF